MSTPDSSLDELGDGLLANEAVSSARERPLEAVVADTGDGVGADDADGAADGADEAAGAPARAEGEGMSDAALYVMTINVVVGSGIVGLPFAFHSAGVLLALCFVAGWTSVYVLTLGWLLLALRRAGGDADWIGLVKAFLGRKGEALAAVTVLLMTYGLLWSYASMFSATATLLLSGAFGVGGPECDVYAPHPSQPCVRANRLVSLAFGGLMFPLSLVPLARQQRAQGALTLYRFGAVALMLGTVLGAALGARGDGGGARRALGALGARALRERRWSDGLGIAFSTISISQICHLQTPALVRASAAPERAHVVMGCALLTTGALSAAVGALALYFGERTEQLGTLNWKGYDGVGFDGGAAPPAWAVLARDAVLLLPVLAAASSFPLSAIVLATNLQYVAERRLRAARGGREAGVALWRLLAVAPPCVLSACFHRLSVVFDLTGLFRCSARHPRAHTARARPPADDPFQIGQNRSGRGGLHCTPVAPG